MQLLNLKQGTRKWLEWRRTVITASDAPVIMGVSPYKKIDKLYEEKMNGYESVPNKYMMRGTELEPIALKKFEQETGFSMFPCVGIHSNNWMGASFDGMTIENSVIVEIKCPGKKDHDVAIKGFVPDKYIPQLQHQMFVAELDLTYYYSFDGEEGVILMVERDEEYIKEMLEKEFDFWKCLKKAQCKTALHQEK